MSDTFEDLSALPSPLRLWRGSIAVAPTDASHRLSIIIPDLDPITRFENCRWQSRNSIDIPARGDDCLAALDNNNEWWVISWWPFL